jgi:hypothetical protein
MSRHVIRGLYVFVVVAVCPLLAWNLAVDLANHGSGMSTFLGTLFGLPVAAAVAAAVLLRRRRVEAVFGVLGAAAATVALVVVLVILALSSR